MAWVNEGAIPRHPTTYFEIEIPEEMEKVVDKLWEQHIAPKLEKFEERCKCQWCVEYK